MSGEQPAALQFKPAGWPSAIPRIVAEDARALVEFLRVTFNASGDYHADRPTELRIDDSLLLITEIGERNANTVFIYVYVSDTDAAYKRALAAGAKSIEAPTPMPYGDRRAMIKDRWGNTWQIATRTI
jgi:uncharacterized glyoxalase superfamily protein PhnB